MSKKPEGAAQPHSTQRRGAALAALALCLGVVCAPGGCRGLAHYASAPPVELGLDSSGAQRDAVADAAGDDALGDLAASDGLATEGVPADGCASDAPCARDARAVDAGLTGGTTPIDATALGAALFATSVPCVLDDGTLQGDQLLADQAWAAFFDWSLYVPNVPSADLATIAWAGKPAVMVLWDLNACATESPTGSTAWNEAGLIVRGATLNSAGQLVLASGTTLADLNVVDATTSVVGGWESDPYGPLDVGIPPNLVQPIGGAKALLLTLSQGP